MKNAFDMYLRSTVTEIYYSKFCMLPKSSCKIFIHKRTNSSLISIVHIHKCYTISKLLCRQLPPKYISSRAIKLDTKPSKIVVKIL